jgi:hypothetical protein
MLLHNEAPHDHQNIRCTRGVVTFWSASPHRTRSDAHDDDDDDDDDDADAHGDDDDDADAHGDDDDDDDDADAHSCMQRVCVCTMLEQSPTRKPRTNTHETKKVQKLPSGAESGGTSRFCGTLSLRETNIINHHHHQ